VFLFSEAKVFFDFPEKTSVFPAGGLAVEQYIGSNIYYKGLSAMFVSINLILFLPSDIQHKLSLNIKINH
jgi:hypothetical protein